MIVWITIDNSEDRLSQWVWAEYIKAVDKLVRTHAIQTLASMVHSQPTSRLMSCHWCFELPNSDNFLKQNLWVELSKTARIFKMDSIVWHEVSKAKHVPGMVDEPSTESQAV